VPEVRPVDAFLPTTFLERGAAVPFTSPRLEGARARPGERKPLELVVPNPSGGRGVYIVGWDDIPSLCSLTLHDRRLTAAIGRLRGVTPETIRLTARDVAAEGLAGRGAIAAARLAAERDNLAALQANFDLLLELVRQTEPKGENPVPPEKDRPAEVERRGKRAVARIAARLGCTPEAVAETLEQLARGFASVGVAHLARITAEIAAVASMRREIADFAEQHPDDAAHEAQLVNSVADLTIMLANATVTDARALTADMGALLRRWGNEQDVLAQLLARPDWLLDGWAHICALWQTAPANPQTITEIAALVPVVPREVDMWLSQRLGLAVDLPRYRRKVVQEMEDWRTGLTVYDLVARNEKVMEKAL
jgi:hypothetical protein